MARPKKQPEVVPPVHQDFSVKEIAERHEAEMKSQERLKEEFKRTKNLVKLINLRADERKRFSKYDKEQLRRLILDPEKNEMKLKDFSRFLYRLFYPYRRIVHYYATMIDLTAMICVPDVDIQHANSKKVVLKNYSKVLAQSQKMNMKSQIFKLLVTAWKEDAAFAYAYEDNDAFFLLPLDGDYCKIISQNYDGSYNFAFDFSYFSIYPSLLEYWDKEFLEKWNLYQADGNYRWQELNRDRCFCIKINPELYCIPPFLPLFSAMIDLIDLQDLQAVKDELSAYKLLVMREETMQKATQPDQFTVDLDSAIAYFNLFIKQLPPQVNAALSLLPVDVIDFKGDTTDDVDMISNSMSNLYSSAGVSQILDRNKIEGAVAFTSAMLSDSVMSTANVLPQIEVWVNRYIQYKIGNTPAKIKYLPVTPYTKADYLARVINGAQNGVPVKLQAAALLNQDPYETYAMEFLENECLDISTGGWIPFNTSYTQSGVASSSNGQTATAENPTGAGRPATTGDSVETSGQTTTTTTKTTSTSGGSTTSSTSSTSSTTVG